MSSLTVLKIGSLACLLLLAHSASSSAKAEQGLRQVATLQDARAAHTATTLASGQVLVAGGMTDGGGSLASVELFDPARNAVQAIGSLAVPRVNHTATSLGDGRVLIAGGYNGEYLSSL